MKYIDPTGEEIILPDNKEKASRIINDLNAIYQHKYGNEENAFLLISCKTNKGAKYYKIGANEKFNWNKDKYTKAMKECIDDPVKVYIKMVPNQDPVGPEHSRGRKVHDFINELGGGQTKGKMVYISEDLPTSSKENYTMGKFPKKHSLGGVVMHELLYHLHDIGTEDEADYREGPKIMQRYYMLKRSRVHPAGNSQVFHSKKKKS